MNYMNGNQFFNDMYVSDITVVSGIRSYGTTVDNCCNGRRKSGILYIWSGEVTFYDGAERLFSVPSGSLVFLPKHKKYKMQYTAESTTFVVVNFELFDRTCKELKLFDDITLVAKDDSSNRIAKIMTNFELCSVSKDVGTVFRKKELIYRLIGYIYSTGYYLLSDGESEISEGVRLLEQTYLENLPVYKYAEVSHVSVNTFRRLFKEQFGTSPLKYRNYLRIERAKELLSEGSFNVSNVAYLCGFDNVGYFCRYYLRVTGESPSETRKSTANKINMVQDFK